MDAGNAEHGLVLRTTPQTHPASLLVIRVFQMSDRTVFHPPLDYRPYSQSFPKAGKAPLIATQKSNSIKQEYIRSKIYTSRYVIPVKIRYTLRTRENLLLSKSAKLRRILGASSPFHSLHSLILVLPRPQRALI